MNGRMEFAVAAVVILLAASMVPVVGSQHWIEPGEGGRDGQQEPGVAATARADAEMVEVPVQIHTLHGVQEITRELPVETVKTLYSMLNQTQRAVQMLQMAEASAEVKQEAHLIVDTFLHTLKEHGLLGDMSVARVKSLVTGGYRTAHDHDREQRLTSMAHLFEQNGWRTKAMCYLHAWGGIGATFPVKVPILALADLLHNLFPDAWRIPIILLGILMTVDLIPRPTTIGHWNIGRSLNPGPAPGAGGMEVRGLGGGGQHIELNGGETIEAITVGFTGIIFCLAQAVGFCPFIAYKHHTSAACLTVRELTEKSLHITQDDMIP